MKRGKQYLLIPKEKGRKEEGAIKEKTHSPFFSSFTLSFSSPFVLHFLFPVLTHSLYTSSMFLRIQLLQVHFRLQLERQGTRVERERERAEKDGSIGVKWSLSIHLSLSSLALLSHSIYFPERRRSSASGTFSPFLSHSFSLPPSLGQVAQATTLTSIFPLSSSFPPKVLWSIQFLPSCSSLSSLYPSGCYLLSLFPAFWFSLFLSTLSPLPPPLVLSHVTIKWNERSLSQLTTVIFPFISLSR